MIMSGCKINYGEQVHLYDEAILDDPYYLKVKKKVTALLKTLLSEDGGYFLSKKTEDGLNILPSSIHVGEGWYIDRAIDVDFSESLVAKLFFTVDETHEVDVYYIYCPKCSIEGIFDIFFSERKPFIYRINPFKSGRVEDFNYLWIGLVNADNGVCVRKDNDGAWFSIYGDLERFSEPIRNWFCKNVTFKVNQKVGELNKS